MGVVLPLLPTHPELFSLQGLRGEGEGSEVGASPLADCFAVPAACLCCLSHSIQSMVKHTAFLSLHRL